jgi:hypothetical protein
MHQHAFRQYLSGDASERGLRAWIQGETSPGLVPRLFISALCGIGTEEVGARLLAATAATASRRRISGIFLKNQQAVFSSGPGVLPVRTAPFAGGIEFPKVHFSPPTLRPQRSTAHTRASRLQTLVQLLVPGSTPVMKSGFSVRVCRLCLRRKQEYLEWTVHVLHGKHWAIQTFPWPPVPVGPAGGIMPGAEVRDRV